LQGCSPGGKAHEQVALCDAGHSALKKTRVAFVVHSVAVVTSHWSFE
jgi:hypothetical protein